MIWGANTSNSVFNENSEYVYLLIKSTSLDMSVLMMECLRYPVFVDLLVEAHPIYKSKVKTQIGYKYWERRTHTWRNEYAMYGNEKFIAFAGRNEESKMMTIICYHYVDQVVIVCNECKLNMCLRDITSIR